MTLERSILEFKEISKSFGTNQVCKQVSFELKQNEIHCLVGENGAGKSTLLKILFGYEKADNGSIYLRNKKLELRNPIEAKSLGMGIVHQHFMLAGGMTALDNMILEDNRTQKQKLFTKLNRNEALYRYQKLSEKFAMPVPWESKIESLSVGVQQRIELLKILNNQAEILILDEPTAVLSPLEIEIFFNQLKQLKSEGKTILLVTHKLKEVFALADRVTVLRAGKTVMTKLISETSQDEIAESILGQKLNTQKRTLQSAGSCFIELKDLTLKEKKSQKYLLKKINLKIHRKEIVGIAGIEGNGQNELFHLLISPKEYQSQYEGKLLFDNENSFQNSIQDIRKKGLRFLPQDRFQQSSLVDHSLQDNFILGQHREIQFQSHGILNDDMIKTETQKAIQEFDVRPGIVEAKFHQLSGGNQQKLIVARELSQDPQFILAAQPTRGVDIGASQQIHQRLMQEKLNGKAILLISSDLDEVMQLADQLVVFFKGEIVGLIPNWSQLNDHDQKSLMPQIGKWMVGTEKQETI